MHFTKIRGIFEQNFYRGIIGVQNHAHTLNMLNCSDVWYVNVCIFKYYAAFEVVKVLLKYEKIIKTLQKGIIK